MAGARIIFPDFREEQSMSRYPFADSATLKDRTGDKEITQDSFIDAIIYAIGSDLKAHISQIVVDNGRVTIVVANFRGIKIASGSYNPLLPPENGQLPLTDSYGRPAGLLLLTQDAMARFSGWGVGVWVFTQAATEFVSTAVIPAQEEGVRALTNTVDQFFTGDVWIVGSDGVVVRTEPGNVIRVDVVGEPLFKRILCDSETAPFNPPTPIRTINGCGPDEFGNFTLTVTDTPAIGIKAPVLDPILRISPAADALQISIVGTGVV